MVFEIDEQFSDSRAFTLAVLQVTQLLGLFHAELARILGVRCGEVGALSNGSAVIDRDAAESEPARQLIRMYRLLYRYCRGDSVAMCHWLRRTDPRLGQSPLLHMVDNGGISRVVAELEERKPDHFEEAVDG